MFAHDLDELRAPPDFARTTLCKFVVRHGRCKHAECKFAHSLDQLKHRVEPKAAKLQPETSTNATDTMVMTSATAGGDLDAFDPMLRPYIHGRDLSWHIDRSHAFMVYGMNEDMDKGSLQPPLQCTISGAGTTAGTVSPHRTVTQDFKSQQRHSHCPVAGMNHDMDRKCLEPSSQHEDSIDCLADVTLRPNGTVVPDLVYQNLYNSYPMGRMSSNMDTERLESPSEYSISSAEATAGAVRPHRNHGKDRKCVSMSAFHSSSTSFSHSSSTTASSLERNDSQFNFTGELMAPSSTKMSSVAFAHDPSIHSFRWQ